MKKPPLNFEPSNCVVNDDTHDWGGNVAVIGLTVNEKYIEIRKKPNQIRLLKQDTTTCPSELMSSDPYS